MGTEPRVNATAETDAVSRSRAKIRVRMVGPAVPMSGLVKVVEVVMGSTLRATGRHSNYLTGNGGRSVVDATFVA